MSPLREMTGKHGLLAYFFLTLYSLASWIPLLAVASLAFTSGSIVGGISALALAFCMSLWVFDEYIPRKKIDELSTQGFINNVMEPVGAYVLGCGGVAEFRISQYTKPSFIKRFLMKHLLGFEWVDS